MPTLHVPIAIPGSGKTTWTREVLSSALCVSTDGIREEMAGPEGYVYSKESNAIVFQTFHTRLAQYLNNGLPVVADATNLQKRHRQELLEVAGDTGAQVHYIIFTNVAQAVLRNARREIARVPDDSMLRFVEQYEQALKDVPEEPYDFITYIEKTG